MKSFLRTAAAVAAAALLLFSAFLFFKAGTADRELIPVEGSLSDLADGTRVILRGPLVWSEPAADPEFGCTVKSPLLLRKVEMVQWSAGQDGGILVFSEESIPGTEAGTNPPFPDLPKGACFASDATVGGIPVSADVLRALLGGGRSVLSAVKAAAVDQVIPGKGDAYGLAAFEGGIFATPGEEWKAGDLRVSFLYPDCSAVRELTVLGVKRGDTVELGDDGMVWDTAVDEQTVRACLGADPRPAALASLAAGILLLAAALLPALLSKKKNARSFS